ncbi:uncharacterized protein LOC111373849 isoform X2 [Olea europaea var. sylvestris]|uniref:uncharacterized protein LOC111373849 isoform X2 n=1 Tax=Olea europaea var. sylvestris TaxID=158386 RepID=UPI000C1CDE37|nr:uncharacterized protein LOC111373849 isoform X2 [Olea europaea var. sylvestris]
MSTDKKNIKPTIPLKLLVDKKKTRVLAAEATSDFVNVLLSFLTLPLGTVVRVTKNHPGSIGCMDNLYQSIEQLSADKFCTEACKSILLSPRNPRALVCKNLKLNIDDTSNGICFSCNNRYCCRKSHYPCTKCVCGSIANTEKSEESQPLDPEHFVKRTTVCVITDNLQVLPGNPISLVQLLCNLGFSDVDQVEELSVDVGLEEVSKLLKLSLVSKTPLTELFLGKRKLSNISIPVDPRNSPTPSSENKTMPNHTEFRVKLILSKSQNKILSLLVREDFIDFLFNFCTVPLGSVVKLLDLNSGVGCVDNLYRTVKCLDSEWLAISKNEIINAGVLKQYKCKNNPLQIRDAINISNLLDPRGPTGSVDCFGRFMEAPCWFVVSDKLVVTQLSSPSSSISFLKELNVPLNDIEEQEETIGETEALALLKASLTSSSALNNCFKSSINQKLNKSDVAAK